MIMTIGHLLKNKYKLPESTILAFDKSLAKHLEQISMEKKLYEVSNLLASLMFKGIILKDSIFYLNKVIADLQADGKVLLFHKHQNRIFQFLGV